MALVRLPWEDGIVFTPQLDTFERCSPHLHTQNTHTHAHTSTIYVCEDEMRREVEEKGCCCCLDSKIEVATQQRSLKSFVSKIHRVTHQTIGEKGTGRRDFDTLYCLNILLAQFEIKLSLFLPCCCCCNVIQTRRPCSNQLYELLTA